MRRYVPGYPGARDYLTPEAATRWDPAAQIQVVREGTAAVRKVTDGQVLLSAQVTGLVRADGTYLPAPDGASAEYTIPLSQVDGEWRIAEPPPGLLLSESQFDREYAPYNVYFPSPATGVVVPDQVMLPVGGGNQSTLLVQALLRGPTEWLAPAVATAFPEGTELVTASVPVREDGVAVVNMTSEARAASPEERRRMAAQLFVTLSQLTGIDEVAITVEGTPLSVPGTSPDDGVVSAATVGNLDPTSTDRVARRSMPFSAGGSSRSCRTRARPPRSAGRSVRRAPACGRSGCRSTAGRWPPWMGPARGCCAAGSTVASCRKWRRARICQRRPGGRTTWSGWSIGRQQGRGCCGPRARRSRRWSLQTWRRGRSTPYASTPTASGCCSSPSGTGAASRWSGCSSRTGDEDQSSWSLVNLREVPFDNGPVLDAGWTDVSHIGVLAGSEEQSVRTPYIVALNGLDATSRPGVPGGEQIAASPAVRERFVVSTSDGRLQQQDSRGRWVPVGDGVAPAFPG